MRLNTHTFGSLHALKTIVMIAMLALIGGCSNHASIDAWHRSLEQHASADFSGDMSFLRDPGGDEVHKRFAVLGGPSPDNSTDVSGALLGRRAFHGDDWLIFVIANVKNRQVQDIRIAAITDEPGRRRWKISEENDAALRTYLRHKESQWRRLHPGRTEAPITPGLFPPDEDVYRLEISGSSILVTEENSGARWTLIVPPRAAGR